MTDTSTTTFGTPSLRVIRGAFYDQPRLVPVAHDGFDDPGPSAA